RLEAELNAPQVDLDAAVDFGRALFSGSALTRPQDMTLVADFGRVIYSGIDARDAHVRLKVDGKGMQIDRLSIGDLVSGSVLANGRIETAEHAPSGMLSVDLETRQVAALAAIGARFTPMLSSRAVETLKRVGHAKLHARLDVTPGDLTSESRAQLAVNGSL